VIPKRICIVATIPFLLKWFIVPRLSWLDRIGFNRIECSGEKFIWRTLVVRWRGELVLVLKIMTEQKIPNLLSIFKRGYAT
jgi:hypothetical protein